MRIWKSEALPADWFKRQTENAKATREFQDKVQNVITRVRERGDDGLLGCINDFDKCSLTKKTLNVRKEEIKEAYT